MSRRSVVDSLALPTYQILPAEKRENSQSPWPFGLLSSKSAGALYWSSGDDHMATVPKPLSGLKARADSPSKKAAATGRATRTPESIPASQAKAHLLELLNAVDHKGESIIITKRGRPVAKLVPIESQPARDIFGYMKGTFRITGDIVGPEPDVWEATS
jgi:prevent-host-death family protein